MNPEKFEDCKEISDYDEFMEASTSVSLEEYKEFMSNIFEVVPEREEKDPVKLYEKTIEELRSRWVASEKIPVHGPWHHGLVGGILVTSLKNNGYSFSEEDIEEALERGLMIPGGACGFHGSCGAASGLGIAVSIATRGTPFHDEKRTKALTANSKAYKRIAELGGPRCCTLSTYTTLDLAEEILKEIGYSIPLSDVEGRCKVYRENDECHGIKCPYFPDK
ncbi:MAG: Redox-active protein with multiple conserved metal-binding region [Candidatus Methanohalarchaeum thermophilum]|uniref:Redox-active protein with multiple conserved metal-binding region n=1 Tax=Methanohalarchaeum thermophilum TaxID=1903181 RepID=A0A1Q6DTT7_METT1|nr:MAG: Redox-active protein with multiple conserved metal-binding region [Candidatus Methanohalarchaeum thermophilum]